MNGAYEAYCTQYVVYSLFHRCLFGVSLDGADAIMAVNGVGVIKRVGREIVITLYFKSCGLIDKFKGVEILCAELEHTCVVSVWFVVECWMGINHFKIVDEHGFLDQFI